MKRVLVIGGSGMLGHSVVGVLSQSPGFTVIGSVRSEVARNLLPERMRKFIISGIDVESADSLHRLFHEAQPDVVVNCVGVVKQLAEASDPLRAIPINSLVPHRLAALCELVGARLVHLSTDCVFSGTRGMYSEQDAPDAYDLYGRTKLLGEVDYPHAVTLRTSIIGHELQGARSLISWFLAQTGAVRGFTRAVFSGLPTVEIAQLIRDVVIPRETMRGLYHVSAEPINKFELLTLVKEIYGKDIEIIPDDSVAIDRSLDSRRFRGETGFEPKPWRDLVVHMREGEYR
jgi:dTDP-4-dehydrorhamnose reductase